jgi:hypothetical protein
VGGDGGGIGGGKGGGGVRCPGAGAGAEIEDVL